MPRFLLTMVICCAGVNAQGTTARPTVQAAGQASVYLPPDQVKLDATVMTQGTTAQDAAAQNANQVTAVVASLQKLLGPGADIKTVNYYVTPNYKQPKGGGPGTIVSYTASMTVEVTLATISMAGAVIDAAVGGGATSVGSPQFSLKDPEPARLQALRLAAMQAKNHADAIASGLGHTTGAILLLQEGTTVNVPIITGVGAPTGGGATQVTPGLIQVQGTVVLQTELL